MRSWIGFAFACVAACGSSGGGNHNSTDAGSGSGGGHFVTWDFNGTSYSGSMLATATLGSNEAGGDMPSVEAADANGAILALGVVPATPETIAAPGTYTVSPTSTAPFAAIQMTLGSDTWKADGSGGSGEITITAISTGDFTGTFSGTLVPVDGNANGSGALTNGAFDLAPN